MATSRLITDRIRALKAQFDRMRSGKDALLVLIDEAEVAEGVYNSNAIENSTLSLPETEKILLETDCPFLVPASRRGQRNDPLTIFEIAQTIAEMKKIDQAEVLKLTTDNAVRLFGLNVA